MNMYVPMFIRQRDMKMNKADLVTEDYSDDDYNCNHRPPRNDLGIILGFTCGESYYDNFYAALDSPEALREVVEVKVQWGKGDITNELAPCLAVISHGSR